MTMARLKNRKTGLPVTAVVPVHLYGQTADMDPILELAERYNLIVIEDACQAHGAEYFSKKDNRWKKAGSMGAAAAFSFYPGKNLGACGEAGAVTTNDAEMARKMRMLRDHGQSQKYYHEVEGYNGRLDAIQAGILGIKLKHLAAIGTNPTPGMRGSLSRVARRPSGRIILPFEPAWSKAVYHLFVVRVQDRSQLSEASCRRTHRYRDPLSDSTASAERLCTTSVTGRAASRSPRGWRRKLFLCRCSRGSKRPSRIGLPKAYSISLRLTRPQPALWQPRPKRPPASDKHVDSACIRSDYSSAERGTVHRAHPAVHGGSNC